MDRITEAETADDVLVFLKGKCATPEIFEHVERALENLLSILNEFLPNQISTSLKTTYTRGALTYEETEYPGNKKIALGTELIFHITDEINPGFIFVLDSAEKIVEWFPRNPDLPIVKGNVVQ